MNRRLRAFLVDDEALALRRLRRLLDATGRIEVVGEATDPRGAAAAITAASVDVAFLDIEMPAVGGLQIAAQLPALPWIVFVTAHARYALDAFEVSAIDYLVKPVREHDLDRALDKLERSAAAPKAEATAEALAGRIEKALQAASGPAARIAARSGARHIMLDVRRITHFQASAKLTLAYADGAAFDVEATLGALEERLSSSFVRIHRALLVNWLHIREVDARSGAGAYVRLDDAKATELPVARDRIRELKDKMGI